MAKKKLPRNYFVLASFERKNNMGKGGEIVSIKDKARYNRKFRKQEFRKEMERSGSIDAPFFIYW